MFPESFLMLKTQKVSDMFLESIKTKKVLDMFPKRIEDDAIQEVSQKENMNKDEDV